MFVCKTIVKKLKTSRPLETSIVKITGHKNPTGLQDYDEADENEFHQLSNVIPIFLDYNFLDRHLRNLIGSRHIATSPNIFVTEC